MMTKHSKTTKKCADMVAIGWAEDVIDDSIATTDPRNDGEAQDLKVELFVSAGFCDFELASVVQTLAAANDILDRDTFSWRVVSDAPVIVTGACGMMVRAEPAIDDYGFSDLMIVVGGAQAFHARWLRRARAMQHKALPVVLLSDAATAYIKATKSPSGKVTTHWRDLATLVETGYHPNLTARFSESSDGIITSAGAGATSELVIGLVAPFLESVQVAELGNRLLLHTIRRSNAEQPKNIADNEGLFDSNVTEAIRRMEETIANPIPIEELAIELNLSRRHLERIFRRVLDDTPAKFYKRLRCKHARKMLEETLLPMVEVAVASGFESRDTLAKAIKAEYGLTPFKMRARKKISLLSYQPS